MNILIVGGAGYVGGALTDSIDMCEHAVIVYDALLYEESYRKDVPFVRGDVRDRKKLKQYLDWADSVIWLAALVGDGACALDPDITDEINHKAVKWLVKNFDGRIVFMSTCSVYGAQDNMLREDSPTMPLSVYAASKLDAEKALEGSNAIIYRLGTLFGIGDLFSRIRMDLVVNVLCSKAYSDGVIKVFGGDQWRPLLHVCDAAYMAYCGALGTETGIYNLASQNVKIIDLAEQVVEQFPDAIIETTKMHFQDTRNYKASAQKAIDELDFMPTLFIEDGVKELKELLEEERMTDLSNPRYSNQSFLTKYKTHK